MKKEKKLQTNAKKERGTECIPVIAPALRGVSRAPENSFRKKTRYASKFQEKWKTEFDFFESSERGDSFAFRKL